MFTVCLLFGSPEFWSSSCNIQFFWYKKEEEMDQIEKQEI